MDALQPLPAPDHCDLHHPLFTSLANPLFRHAEADGAPVMVVMLGEREAAIPLRSLQHEFGIPDESDDGRMLELIAQSLDFVACLRPGDALPAEVLSGAASWEPDEMHLKIANARLQWQLVTWLNSGTGAEEQALDAESILQVADEETLTQVRRLTGIALKLIARRFEELDAQTGEVMAALRNAESQRAFIRSNRDWLYRTQRAWQSLLLEWDVAGTSFDEGMMLLLGRSYQFLAPRFMPVTEWTAVLRPTKKDKPVRRMVW